MRPASDKIAKDMGLEATAASEDFTEALSELTRRTTYSLQFQ